jgi:hypothetical protein
MSCKEYYEEATDDDDDDDDDDDGLSLSHVKWECK